MLGAGPSTRMHMTLNACARIRCRCADAEDAGKERDAMLPAIRAKCA